MRFITFVRSGYHTRYITRASILFRARDLNMRQDAIASGLLKATVASVSLSHGISSRIEVRAHFRDLLFVSHVGHGTDCFAVTINSGIFPLSLFHTIEPYTYACRASLRSFKNLDSGENYTIGQRSL